MKIQANAVNLLERTSAFLKAGLLTQKPAWYDVVASVPPSKGFSRSVKGNGGDVAAKEFSESRGLYRTRLSAVEKNATARGLYAPRKLKYIEDQLREVFYKQHPWELSRPKMLVENDVGQAHDWSHLLQIDKPLDGESVVQRALYIAKQEGKGLAQAYDSARYEFYRLRMEQEAEEQVAQEESQLVGSVFGPSAIEHGIEVEQKFIDTWKARTIQETELANARRANPSEAWNSQTESATDQDVELETKEI